jgi:hypothetical protein
VHCAGPEHLLPNLNVSLDIFIQTLKETDQLIFETFVNKAIFLISHPKNRFSLYPYFVFLFAALFLFRHKIRDKITEINLFFVLPNTITLL